MQVIPWIISGMLVGVGIMQLGFVWWEGSHPGRVEVQSIITEPLPDGGYKLTVGLLSPDSPDCVRISGHLLSPQGDEQKTRSYQPLATAMAGGLFSSGGATDVYLKVHPFMVDKGSVWSYQYRAVYICFQWPGFISLGNWQSDYIPVRFP